MADSKEQKKLKENIYQRVNKISSVWDVATIMQKKGVNTSLWKNSIFNKQIQSVRKLEISAKVLRKHLPVKYLELVRIGWQWEDSTWLLFVQNTMLANKLNYLLDEMSLLIAKDIGYAPRIKVLLTPKNWHLSGISLVDHKSKKQETPTIEEADKIIKEFINQAD